MVKKFVKKTFRKKRKMYKKKYNKKFKRTRGIRTNQYYNIKRVFDFATPPAYHLVSPPTYGVVPYLRVGATTSTYSYASAAYRFDLNDIPNILNYGTLFDQYKINSVKLIFTYLTSTSAFSYSNLAGVINPQNQVVTLAIYTDYDDHNAPLLTDAEWVKCQQTGRAKYYTFPNQRKNSFSYTIKPRLMEAILDTEGGFQASRVSKSGWLDGNTNNEVLFRGVKVLVQVPPADLELQDVIHTWKITAVYNVSFRHIK